GFPSNRLCQIAFVIYALGQAPGAFSFPATRRATTGYNRTVLPPPTSDSAIACTHAQKTHRGRPAAGQDQRGGGAGEVDPARAPVHAAPVVGAAAAGGVPRGPLRLAGGRSGQRPGLP